MASGDVKASKQCATGQITGTGDTISIIAGFRPKVVLLKNITGEALLFWNDVMPDASGYKINGVGGGTAAAQTFTPSTTAGNLNLATPAFSGTGLTAAGQVMATTDNQTMTLNQCAGMWLIPATEATPPMLILSNTAVTDAPAVLTVQGAAATDAGAYKIVRTLTTGTNAASAVTGGAADSAYISSLGITPMFNGFQIGADTDVNVVAETIYWEAWK